MARKIIELPSKRGPLPPVQCSHIECPRAATLRIKRPTGWANLCEYHDIYHVTEDAKDWLADNNLLREPGEDMRLWMRRTLVFLKARAANKPRIAGVKSVADFLISPKRPELAEETRAMLRHLET